VIWSLVIIRIFVFFGLLMHWDGVQGGFGIQLIDGSQRWWGNRLLSVFVWTMFSSEAYKREISSQVWLRFGKFGMVPLHILDSNKPFSPYNIPSSRLTPPFFSYHSHVGMHPTTQSHPILFLTNCNKAIHLLTFTSSLIRVPITLFCMRCMKSRIPSDMFIHMTISRTGRCVYRPLSLLEPAG